ncbi:MAG: alpha/beta hydrolase [Pacificimonas sp.]
MLRKLTLAGLGLLLLGCSLFLVFRTSDIDAEDLRAAYTNADSEFVRVQDGLDVHIRDEGRPGAPVLMLVHGSSASLHTWEPWVERLGDRYRIVSLDLPGHGLTGPHPDACYTAACVVDVVDTVASARGLDDFVIGGNSMGGWVSWNYALAHPKKLAGMILVDASGITLPREDEDGIPIGFRIMRTPVINQIGTQITPRSMIESSLRTSVVDPAFVTDEQVDRYWELLRHPGNRQATIDRANTPRGEEATPERLATLTLPTLVMWGREDSLIDVRVGELFDERLPDSELIIYEDIGHLPQEELPDRSAADVAAFLDRVFGEGGQ